MFLFSSKTIPGNEVGVAHILNALSEKGVHVVEDDDRYHVSGHANRPDLKTMHDLIRPAIVVPMHGEHRHLVAHAALAAEGGLTSVVAPNGSLVDLSAERPAVVERIESGRLYLDGTEIIGALDGVVRDRIRLATRGLAIVSLIIDEAGKPVGDAWVETRGLAETDRHRDGLAGALEEEIGRELGRAKRGVLDDDSALEELVTRAVARRCNDAIGRKPVCVVMISRLEA
jgi:ribonuclease J